MLSIAQHSRDDPSETYMRHTASIDYTTESETIFMEVITFLEFDKYCILELSSTTKEKEFKKT